MQFLVIFLVYALAVGNAEECTEERAEACVESLLSSILGDTSEEEVCKELRTSINCLRSAVDECISDEEKDDEVEEGLQELEKVLKDNCKESDDDDDDDEQVSDEEDAQIQQCFEDNEEYIYECVYEGSAQALSAMIEHNADLDEDVLQCTMYALMSACFIERIGEKCGAKAAEFAEKDLSDMPPEILAACTASGNIEAHSFQLLDKKRK